MQQRVLYGGLAELLQNGRPEMESRNRILPLQVSSVLYVHVTLNRNKFIFNKTNKTHEFPKFYFVKKILHISSISFAHHQEFSAVHSTLVYFLQI